MKTIILSHPWDKSFNYAIANTLVEKFEKNGQSYQIIDLYKDGFNPTISVEELAEYSTGKVLDPLVKKYQEMLSKTAELYIIYPIWWGVMPAILKGFFDRVMTLHFAFNYENGWNPLLGNIIQTATVITTSQSPKEWYRNDVENVLFAQILKGGIGIQTNRWFHIDSVSNSPREHKTAFLNELKAEI